jgi:hypothetical protein
MRQLNRASESGLPGIVVEVRMVHINTIGGSADR